MTKEIVFVLGGPGSGKGTQAQTIAKDYELGYLSTGDLLRAATNDLNAPEDDPDWQERADGLRQIMRNGELVPDATILELVKAEIERSDKPIFFVDGFPRNVAQANLFEAEIAPPKAVLFLDVADAELTRRLLDRGKTSGRADDNAASIAKRLVTYHEQSFPVIDHYTPQGKVIKIDGARSISAVRADILFELRKFWNIPKKDGEPEREPPGAAPRSAACSSKLLHNTNQSSLDRCSPPRSAQLHAGDQYFKAGVLEGCSSPHADITARWMCICCLLRNGAR
jgi:adenylate kinase